MQLHSRWLWLTCRPDFGDSNHFFYFYHFKHVYVCMHVCIGRCPKRPEASNAIVSALTGMLGTDTRTRQDQSVFFMLSYLSSPELQLFFLQLCDPGQTDLTSRLKFIICKMETISCGLIMMVKLYSIRGRSKKPWSHVITNTHSPATLPL